MSGSGVWSTQTWTVSAVAASAGDYEFDFDYSGFHAWFSVTAFLDAFDPSGSGNLYSGGPVNCCNPPSGGFNEFGTIVFSNLSAGDVFGFRMGGRNFDADSRLLGTLNIAQVPEPTILALMGLGLAGIGFSRRRTL